MRYRCHAISLSKLLHASTYATDFLIKLDMAPWGPPEATVEGAALSFIKSGASVKVAFCTAEKSESKSLQQYLYPGMLSIFSIHASLVLHQRRKELAGVTVLPE